MSFAGNPESAQTGFSPAPPPPPPPPPAPGQAPALRIHTAEAPRPRRPQTNNDPYEPPAAIQNAMMTKDKKPFTYTPGMGGKLDLSQIRSPRMARRVAKNANDEGIEGPPKSALEPKPATSGNIYVQPQVAVPVFPASMPAQRTQSTLVTRVPSNASNSQPESPRSIGRNEGKVTPITIVPSVPSSPQSPTSPPQITLAKAPTPWLQNKPKQQEELPEWAKRASANANRPIEIGSDESSLPANAYQESTSPQPQIVRQVASPQPRQQDRVIPIRVEDRPSVFSVLNEPAGHHQFKQSAPNQQQRWGQAQPQTNIQQQNSQQGGSRIIPIMVEDNGQPQGRNIPIDIQGPKAIVHRGPAAAGPANQAEPGPVQSRSFRVLQKITDTDSDTDVDGNTEQIRKLQLTEDDKVLMHKFKEQVDGETYLHQEEDPRYRGAAIPSRAFRFLQNMTDSGEVSTTSNAPRPASAINKKMNRNSQSFEEAQANLPPSEQQVQEPKKYMGSAIPSRSFRILQAMTSPDNIAPQENHQQDFTSRTENSVTGNQQSGLFFPNCPSPYWNHESGWWGYYPVQYAPQNAPNNVPPPPINLAYNPYGYCAGYPDGNSFAYYPIYDQNYAQNYANYNYTNTENGHPPQEVDQTYSFDGYGAYQNPESNYHQHHGVQEPPAGEEESANFNPPTSDTKESNKNVDYLTVPKWTNQNRTAKTTDADVKKNGLDSSKGRIDSDKESSACTTSSKTDTESDSDSSDSDSDSDSSDSSDSSSSSGSSTDSESEYHAYTSALVVPKVVASNEEPKECIQSLSATTISEDCYEHSSKLSSDKLSCSDCDSDADDEYQIESLNNDCILPHQLSVIYEDTEQTETESDSKKIEKTVKENATETGDPPDDGDDTTVSVSLPLRFKFSVSENNEDVTTVIVGDSTVKSGRIFDAEETISSSRTEPDDDNEVHVNFKIKKTDNTSVDFTLKKHKGSQDESFDTEFTLVNEEARVDLRQSSDESVDAKVVPNGEVRGTDCRENVETEFTIRRKKTDVTKHVWKKDLNLETEDSIEATSKNDEQLEDTVTKYTVGCETHNLTGNGHETEYEVTTSTTEIEEDVHREIIEQKSLKIKEQESVKTEFDVKKIKKNPIQVEVEIEVEEKDENENENESMAFNAAKGLLSVQNSRDETDDEDSGVTSDMSRIISEVDTDSECASVKRMNKYQRTQTHSRLFKLLNDDAVLEEEDSSEECYSPGRRDHLSLPLKTNAFSYDENYYSNYSSGITSPDYSPMCEQSWRRIHFESDNSSAVTTPNEGVDLTETLNNYGVFTVGDKPGPGEDPYFQTWKKVASPVAFDYDILPSIAFKKLKKFENGISSYNGKSNRVNVLCPRIKSSKNVPQALQQSQIKATAASSIPFLSTKSSLKNGHC